MSVYTPLSLDEVRTFAAPYGLEVLELNPIQGGIQNTNYFVSFTDLSMSHPSAFPVKRTSKLDEQIKN